MRVIVAGSRSIINAALVVEAAIASSGLTMGTLICGCALGGDICGWACARVNEVPVEFYPAWEHQRDWARIASFPGEIIHDCPHAGRASGFVRNAEMAKSADALIAIWDGESTGTAHMIAVMKKLSKPVYVLNCRLKETPVFTADEVASLNGFQRSESWHPFTCGNEHKGQPSLVATRSGWACLECDYTQDWAHAFMKDWSWNKRDAMLDEMRADRTRT